MNGRATITQLILYLEEIHKAYDKDDDVICIYLDFSRVFDSVQQSILLNKMGSLGVGENFLRLLASYSTNREHSVNAESCLSSWASV